MCLTDAVNNNLNAYGPLEFLEPRDEARSKPYLS